MERIIIQSESVKGRDYLGRRAVDGISLDF
jgi:hypothetical protein